MTGKTVDAKITRTIHIPVGSKELTGDLEISPFSHGLVLFAHGSGSSRFSPRNQYVAQILQNANIGTLLIDLLTPEEEKVDERTRALRFDIDMLANRLVELIDWLVVNEETEGLGIGLFGASTGAAAAIISATRRNKWVKALVSRGGRPDLASSDLASLEAPTLLIVGSEDFQVLELNRRALAAMSCTRSLQVVPGATHLFEETGTLEKAANLAKDWFAKYLR